MTVALLGSLECAQGILKMGPCSAKQHGQSEFCVESAHDTTRSSGTAQQQKTSTTQEGSSPFAVSFPGPPHVDISFSWSNWGDLGLVTPPETRLSRTALQFPNFQVGCQAETRRDMAGNTRDERPCGPEPDVGSRAEAQTALLSWERADGVAST
jgi:hypothetical protein